MTLKDELRKRPKEILEILLGGATGQQGESLLFACPFGSHHISLSGKGTVYCETCGTGHTPLSLYAAVRGIDYETESEKVYLEVGRALALDTSQIERRSRLKAFGVGEVSLEEVLELGQKDYEYVWDGILPRGALCMVASPPKVGKSVLVRNLIVSMSRGDDFLGRSTRKGKVFYLPIEEGKTQFSIALSRIGLRRDDDISILDTSRFDPSLSTPVIEEICSGNPCLVVIDPMQPFLGIDNLNDYARVYPPLNQLAHLAHNSGTTILLIHHTNKSIDHEGSAKILGSQAVRAAMDNNILMDKLPNGTRIVLPGDMRIGREFDPFVVSFDEGTERITYGGTADDAKSLILASRITEAILAENRPLSRSELSQLLGASVGDVWRCLQKNPTKNLEKIRVGNREAYTVMGYEEIDAKELVEEDPPNREMPF